MKCANHLCGSEFSPDRKRQIYCCKGCQKEARNWRKVRGEVIVSAALRREPLEPYADSIRREYGSQ